LRGTNVRDRSAPSRRGRIAACAAAGLLLSLAARAQFSATVSADSDYRARGVRLSGSRPAVRLTGNIDTPSGWYAGASATQAQIVRDDRYAQLVGYGGYAARAVAGRSWEFGASYAHFIGSTFYDFAEAYAGITSQRWSLRLNYSPDYYGRHVQTAYLDASGHLPLNDLVRLFAHIGLLAPLNRRELGGADANRARADLRAGAGYAIGNADLQLAWTVTSRGGPFPAPSAQRLSGWLFSASYSF
jgi:uncharacterized protein (TIGR02001 family)